MAAAFRHVSLLAFTLLAVVIVASAVGGARSVQVAHALEPESFSAVDPPKVYEGDYSHGAPAGNPTNANPGLGPLNGYCVTVQNAGISGSASAGLLGFTAINGTVLDTDYYNGGTATTVGDIYCATVVPNLLERPDMDGTMTVRWHYTDGVTTDSTDLVIDVFRIELEAFDGFVRGAAEICTVNWDPGVLTGRHSNLAGAIPNPVDDVRQGADPPAADADQRDWLVSGGANLEKLGQFRRGQEWCLSLTADAATADVSVTLQFDAVYNRQTTLDDSQHAESATLDFTVPDYSQVQHVTAGGLLQSSPVSNVNVIGSVTAACIIPSSRDDVIGGQGIQIGPGNVIGLGTFYNDRDTIFSGVPDDTLCFSWSSTDTYNQFIQAGFVYNVGQPDEEVRSARWDTNGDGNGEESLANAPLVARWGVIDRTEITRGNVPDQGVVTNSRFEVGIGLNLVDGFFGVAPIGLTEWVYGRTGPDRDVTDLLDRVILEANIVSNCGYFLTDDPVDLDRKTLEGVSVGGRLDHTGDGLPDDLSVTITNDPRCTQNSVIRIEIDAYYPIPGSSQRGTFFGTEWVEISFRYIPPLKTPRVAWAGQTVFTTFAFAGSCEPFDGVTIQFVASSSSTQGGTFLPGPGVTIHGRSSASGVFSNDSQPGHDACSFTVGYESEDPGEVDIEVFFEGRPWTLVAFPIFYLALEDVSVSSTPDLTVSARGTLGATVRGWFPGNNISGREATHYEDGRVTPENRWVLPDDWHILRGHPEDRPNWPDNAPMPPARVTFYMEDEDVVNQWPDGPTEGAAGWFLMDGGEYSLNVNPRTNRASTQGSVLRPRIISDTTGTGGSTTVGIIGDLNLTYEDCPVNLATGNPHCGLDNIVGSTRYYAVADYPEVRNLGKHPPVYSNTTETIWRWGGYKEVTVVDTDSPTIKYVVLHMKDRDGFCDAYFQHNVLGIEVDFHIDAGSGRITGVAGRPSEIGIDNRRATATTFDILDDLGNPMNEDIAMPTRFGDQDECQAWVRVSNSLLQPTNMLITIPGQPAPIPGDLRITGLQCTGNESVTVTNVGDNPISLAGFSLRSMRDDLVDPEQHLGLEGYLEPGESKTFPGGPAAGDHGWLFTTAGRVFADGPADYARIVWNEFEIHRVECGGREYLPTPPDPLPADGEGELMLNVIIPFGEDEGSVDFVQGWNLFAMNGSAKPISTVLGSSYDDVVAVYRFNAATGGWDRHFTDAPAYASTLDDLQPGTAYWVLVKRPFTLTLQ